MKKNFLWVLAILVLLPGCWGKKKSKKTSKGHKKVALQSEVDIPLAEEISSYFDEDISEFTLLDDDFLDDDFEVAQRFDNVEETIQDAPENFDDQQVALDNLDDDFFWIEDVDVEQEAFKTVYFNFDEYDVRTDQEDFINQNIDLAKKMIERGETPVIAIEGNSCSAAGSRTYNLALSNNRAEVVADRFVANGIPRENIKIVGRGVDNPTLDETGNPIIGDKDQQWPNRRVDVKVY
ncbi:OmpA family protein [Candidatus Dependentiae bacterium]